jgi:hypothetical protein
MEMKSARGRVEATAQNAPERYGLRIGGVWYDGFGQCPVERDDQVEVVYEDSGGRFRNIEEVRPVGSEQLGVRVLEAGRDERVMRCVALKCAATLFASDWATVEEILKTAERFEGWLLRAK